MNCDVFGKRGDFITSPEISQVYIGITCTKLAIWLVYGADLDLDVIVTVL